MDEIEIAFHPDWQHQIITDLNPGLTQKLSQNLLTLCTLRLCGSLFHDFCVSPKINGHLIINIF